MSNPRVILFHKPYGVLSQFTQPRGEGVRRWRTLSQHGPFPPGVYAAGRLDADSEGLLILTNHHGLQHALTDPRTGHPRTYLVQVEGIPDAKSIRTLATGIIVLDGTRVRPADVHLLETDPVLPPRPVPIRYRRSVPTSWLRITLREGRNRQVRRMTAAAGHPTLRLVRISIGALTLGDLQPGEWRELPPEKVHHLEDTLRTAPRSGPARRRGHRR